MYNNEFRDLFGDVGRIVRTKEVAGGVLQLADATEVQCETTAAMAAHINRGNKYRATGATNMNDASSRSHAILTFKIKDNGEVRIVDLAGSERIKRSGAEGGRLQVRQSKFLFGFSTN